MRNNAVLLLRGQLLVRRPRGPEQVSHHGPGRPAVVPVKGVIEQLLAVVGTRQKVEVHPRVRVPDVEVLLNVSIVSLRSPDTAV